MSDTRNPLSAPLRPGSMDVRGQQPSLYPFDAFEFDDPNRNEFPELKMKYPWRLVADYIASSGDAWNYTGVVGIVPEDAYYSGMRAPSDGGLALLNLKKDDLIAANDSDSVFEVTSQRATIAGAVDYELLGQLTKTNGDPWALTDGYTIIVKSETEGWEYLSSEGPVAGNMISLAGTTLNIESTNLLPQLLPFMLLGNSEWFQDLMVIPYGYSQSRLDSLLDGIDNFSPIEGNLSADRGYILSPDGFYWYNGGQYIQLGTEAIFSAVDLKSGDWDGSIEDGEIITTGTQGWAIAHKGDVEFNDGTFRGEIIVGGGGDLDDALADIDQKADDAQADATQALSDAGDAQTEAESKVTTYRSALSSPPTAQDGDLWIVTDKSNTQLIKATGITLGGWVPANWDLPAIESYNFSSGSAGFQITQGGNVEFNDGTFRGNLEVGSDDALRQIFVGDKGLLVEDENDLVLHDLPDIALSTSFSTLGHLYWIDPNAAPPLLSGVVTPNNTWYDRQCYTGGNTNVKGVLLDLTLQVNNSSTDNYITCNFNIVKKGLQQAVNDGIRINQWGRYIKMTKTIIVGVDDDGYIQWNVVDGTSPPLLGSTTVAIYQRGFFV